MNAHRLVIIAAALTTIVAAALATALATFSGQALPRAVQHDLGHATGTSLSISGSVNASQAAQYNAVLPAQIRSALGGTAFSFYQAVWSDPLDFVLGSLPATPATPAAGAGSGATRNMPIAEAGALGDITGQAELVSGSWPGAPVRGQPVPAALPATAAALLHVTVGDVLRMRDGITKRYVGFVVTGLYRPRQVSSPYWNLSLVVPSGSSTASGFTTFGPLTVQPAAFAAGLPVNQGTWLAEPQTASIPADQLTAVAANVNGRDRRWPTPSSSRPSRSLPACPPCWTGSRATWTWPARCWPSAPCCCSCWPLPPCWPRRGCSRANARASPPC